MINDKKLFGAYVIMVNKEALHMVCFCFYSDKTLVCGVCKVFFWFGRETKTLQVFPRSLMLRVQINKKLYFGRLKTSFHLLPYVNSNDF